MWDYTLTGYVSGKSNVFSILAVESQSHLRSNLTTAELMIALACDERVTEVTLHFSNHSYAPAALQLLTFHR